MTLVVKPVDAADVASAERIFRSAFGEILGLSEPEAFFGDAALVQPRWVANPGSVVGAYVDGVLIGSNVVARWGSVGFFGPLTIQPDHWGKGLATPLIQAGLDLLDGWGVECQGLFTFPQSQRHLRLYQKFGFWPRFLTAVLTKAVGPMDQPEGCAVDSGPVTREGADEYRALTEAIFPGLDVSLEIDMVRRQRIGKVLQLREGGELVGMAVCHSGPGSEAGSGESNVKFGGVKPGAGAGERFERLLDGCVWLAGVEGRARVGLGINTACHEAYVRALARGFLGDNQGIAMHRYDRPGYCKGDSFVISDWR